MISYTSLQFYINATAEIIAILFLVILFVSSFLRKSESPAKRAFSLLVLDLVLLLICNMSTWILDGMLVSPTYLPELYILDLVLTVFDFFFYCLAGVLFFNYVCSLTGSMRTKQKRLKIIHTLVLYCFATTAVFGLSIDTGWFCYFPADGYTYYTPAYGVLVVLSNPGIWLSYIFVIRNKKLLKKKLIPLLAYLIVPMLFVVVDQLFGLSASYVCMAFIALSIYVGVDIELDKELLAQGAEIVKQKAENIEMGVKLMTSQIQPHFLYNTLGTIYHLCGKNAELARDTIKNFTKYLRTNMESFEKSTPVPFEQELEHTKNYLSIEMLRFSDILKVEYDIGNTDFDLPALSLQPLVENAVKHGIRGREEGGTVTISVKRENGKIYVSVHDDGMGYDTEHLPDDGRVHVGIANVRKRLDYMCGGKLEIESEIGVGTTATIILEDSKE